MERGDDTCEVLVRASSKSLSHKPKGQKCESFMVSHKRCQSIKVKTEEPQTHASNFTCD